MDWDFHKMQGSGGLGNWWLWIGNDSILLLAAFAHPSPLPIWDRGSPPGAPVAYATPSANIAREHGPPSKASVGTWVPPKQGDQRLRGLRVFQKQTSRHQIRVGDASSFFCVHVFVFTLQAPAGKPPAGEPPTPAPPRPAHRSRRVPCLAGPGTTCPPRRPASTPPTSRLRPSS